MTGSSTVKTAANHAARHQHRSTRLHTPFMQPPKGKISRTTTQGDTQAGPGASRESRNWAKQCSVTRYRDLVKKRTVKKCNFHAENSLFAPSNSVAPITPTNHKCPR